MKLLIVYEDECPYNPIVYVRKVCDKDIDLCVELPRIVKSAVLAVGIDHDENNLIELVDDIAYDLLETGKYTWVREHWCFAIKEVEE